MNTNTKLTQKSAFNVHKIMLKYLNDYEVTENKFYKLTNKIEILSVAIPASTYTAIQDLIHTTLEPIIFTNKSFDEFQKMRRDAKSEWWNEVVNNELRLLIAGER